MAVADVDLALLRQERMRVGTFSDCIRRNREAADGFRTIVFDFEAPQGELQLMRSVDRFPFVPSDPRCCGKIATRPTTSKFRVLLSVCRQQR